MKIVEQDSRIQVPLKKDEPFVIGVNGGVDSYDSTFDFRYPESAYNTTIAIILKNADGESFEQKIRFYESGSTFFQFDNSEKESMTTIFNLIELKSEKDINIEVKLGKVEGGFIRL